MDIKEDYSEKSFAVYGETKKFKDILKNLGGRFNKNLKIDLENIILVKIILYNYGRIYYY